MDVVGLSKLRSTIAVALMLWCAGAGCMIVSYAHAAAMTGAAAHEVRSGDAGWGMASASAGAHDCCKARHKSERRFDSPLPAQASPSESATKETELAEVPNQTDAMSCCPLTSGTFVMSNRQRAGNDESLAARGIDPISIVPNAPVAAARFPELRSPYQSQTHLRLCVFLI